MQKADVVRHLMAVHPGKTLVLVDVDCVVRRDPAHLVAQTRGDVSAFVWSKAAGRAKERARIKVMSGTMVFRPTAAARAFVDNWAGAGRECEAHDVDQTSLMLALAGTSGFTFQPLDAAWCDFDGSHPDPAIVHFNASRYSVRVHWIRRGMLRLARMMQSPARLSPAGGVRVKPRPMSRPDAI